jgi:hypothetical protein
MRGEIVRHDSKDHYLVKDVQICLYKDNGRGIRSIDHLWITVDRNGFSHHPDDLELGINRVGVTSIGTVIKYWRKNGTFDYGVGVNTGADWESMADGWDRMAPVDVRLEQVKEAQEWLDKQELTFQVSVPYSEVAGEIAWFREIAERDLRAQRRAELGAIAHRHNVNQAADRVFSGRKLPKVSGFGK